MKPNNATVFLESVSRLDKRLKYYGEGDVTEITLLKMIYKYATYSAEYKDLQTLDKMVSLLQQKDNNICLNVLPGTSFFPEDSGGGSTPAVSTNNAPTISGSSITVPGQTFSSFVIADFTTDFADVDGDSFGNVIIKTLPANGTLTYNLLPVTVNQTIAKSSIGSLIYTRSVDTAYGTSFTFAIFDDNQNPAQSSAVAMTVTVEAVNAVAVIGDNTIYPANRVETILTLAMFTTDTTLAYSDAEGDLLDAIRIVEISLENQGIYYIEGVAISVGDVITREQMNAGNFKHVGPDSNSISSDVFEFEGRDEGSLTWVK